MPADSIANNRWIAKKAARAICGGIGRILPPSRRSGPEIRVLTYHSFGEGHHAPFTVPAAQFEREMAYLATSGRAISLQDVEAFIQGGKPLRAGSVLVTFDDGDPSVRTIAMPILQKYRIPSVAYILTGNPTGFDLMSFDEIREIQDGGITIGSHSVTHRPVGKLSRAEALRELVESRQRLEDETGRAITSFAYPFGTVKDMTPEVVECVAEAGYTTAFSSLHGAIRAGDASLDPLMLPRVKVESGDAEWLFPALCDGAMDRWRLIDETMTGLQKPAAEHRVAATA